MNKKYSILLSILLLVFTFIYTFKINFDLSQKLNVMNLIIILIVLVLWLSSGYLLILKDVLKSSEREHNGIVLVYVLLGIIFFYYNPFPRPESFNIDLPRITYFIVTLLTFIFFIVIFRKDKLLTLIFAVFIPFSVQSYLVNILNNTSYTDYTFYIVILFIAIAYGFNFIIDKNR